MFDIIKRLFGSTKRTPNTVNAMQADSPLPTGNELTAVGRTPVTHLDCKDLSCPMPIVKLSLKMKQMQVGESIEITATDPAFKADVEAWVRKTGNQLVRFEDQKVKTALISKVSEN